MPDFAHADHPVWREIAPEISADELSYPHKMSATFLRRLSRIRRASGVPFRFVRNGAHRPAARTTTGSLSAHSESPCSAVDIRILSSGERYLILRAALAEGINRIGIYPPTAEQATHFGRNSGTMHLDASRHLPSGVCWVSR
jgi:hypothetical protein